MFKTQRQLLVSLRESIVWAVMVIALVMTVVLRNPLAGAVAMIPNVFPLVVVFGVLGWLGWKIDIGIMMTASVALGVAVDDTVHFITWFRRGLAEGKDRLGATELSYNRCAAAMLQTTLVAGLGLAMFATSEFTPTRQFGLMMVTMLTAALIGDLLLVPALLAGPLGSLFGAAVPQRTSRNDVVGSVALPTTTPVAAHRRQDPAAAVAPHQDLIARLRKLREKAARET